jgi:PAS domain-containing protein
MKDMHCEASGAPSDGPPHAPERVEEPLWQITDRVRDYAIVLLDPKGNVASWHDGAQAITGHEAREIIGCHFSCFYPPEAAARARTELELKIAAVEGCFESEGWRARRDLDRTFADDERRASLGVRVCAKGSKRVSISLREWNGRLRRIRRKRSHAKGATSACTTCAEYD